MRVPQKVVAEIQRARAAGETHQLGRAFLVAGAESDELLEVKLTVSAVEPVDAAAIGPGIYIAFEIPGVLTDFVLLDEAGKNQLLEQLQRHATMVELHRAMAATELAKQTKPLPSAGRRRIVRPGR